MKTDDLAAKILATFPLFMHKAFHDFLPTTGTLDLNKTHMKALMFIYIGNEPYMTEVCHHMNMERGSLTPVIDRLIQTKLVERRGNPGDRRKVHLHLTDLGLSLVQANLHRAHRHVENKLKHLSKEEIQRFRNALLDLHRITLML
jgi:DNA-binding MarR family transcriptional regulator